MCIYIYVYILGIYIYVCMLLMCWYTLAKPAVLLSCCVAPLEAPSQKTFPNRTTIWPKTNVSIILFPTSPSQQASQSASQPASHPATQQLLSYQSQGADLCIYTYMIHTVTHYNITYRMNLNGVINHQIMDCTHVVCDPTRTWTHTYKT